MIDKIIEWFPEDDILKADGFDTAIIGTDEQGFEANLFRNKRAFGVLYDVICQTDVNC